MQATPLYRPDMIIARAIVYRDTPDKDYQFLLLRRWSGRWDFSETVVRPGESTIDAALRKARKDTDLEMLCRRDVKYGTVRYMGHHQIATVGHVLYTRCGQIVDIKQGKGVVEFEWLPYDSIMDVLRDYGDVEFFRNLCSKGNLQKSGLKGTLTA